MNEFLPFASARRGDRIQLVDPEGGWQWPALLLTDPAPCADLCGGLTVLCVLPSGALARQHASAADLMRVISREKADDDVIKSHQGDEQ